MDRFVFGEISADEIEIDARELSARLGGYCTACHDVAEPYLTDILGCMCAKFSAVRRDVTYNEDGSIKIALKTVKSEALTRALDGSDEVFLIAATLGAEVDRYLGRVKAGSLSKHFIADAVASAVAEAVCDAVERRIVGDHPHTKRFSPGYADLPLSFQHMHVALTDASRRTGITLTEDYIMIPTKSITAIIGIKNG